MLTNNHPYRSYGRNNAKQRSTTAPTSTHAVSSTNVSAEAEREVKPPILSAMPYQMYSAAPDQRLSSHTAVKWTMPSHPSLLDALLLEADYYLVLLSLTMVNMSNDTVNLSLLCNDETICHYQSQSPCGKTSTLMITLPLSDFAKQAQLVLFNNGDDELIIQQGSLNLLAMEP